MAPRFTHISEIRPGKTDFKTRVRIMRLWRVADRNNPNIIRSIEMVFLDEKSDKIQASVKQNLFNTFESILQEGSCYIIQNLLVAQKDPRFRAADHNFKLTFMRNTMCMKTDAGAIPENVFKFVGFPEICTGVDDTYLIDVIGHVVERYDMKENEKNGIKNILMDIVLEDLQGNRLDCTLWGNYAQQLHSYLLDHDNNALVIVILQLCKMRLFSGKIGISNSFDATKLLINGNLDEFTRYREKLENGNVSLTQVVSHVSGQSSMSLSDEILQSERMTILEVIETDKVCAPVVIAKIMDFDTAKGWYYEGCTTCARKVTNRVGRLYYCEKCCIPVRSVRRVKIHAQVIDLYGSAYFTLFDRIATRNLSEPVDKLLDSIDKGSDPSAWPKAFDELLDKEMLFKIQITQDNIDNSWQTYTVKKLSAEKSLIEQFKQQHGIKDDEEEDERNIVSAEVGDNIKVVANNDEIVHLHTQSTKENESLQNEATENTPCTKSNRKRLAEDVDCASPNDGFGTQASTTKEPKFVEVKKEKTA